MKEAGNTWSVLMAVLLFSLPLRAQDLGVFTTFGGAAYRMDEMKYLQEFLLDQYPVEGRITSSFPPYGSASVGLLRKFLPQIRGGLGYSYTTTGGRSNYTDYSGRVTTELTLVSHSLGAWLSYSFLNPEPFEFIVYGGVDGSVTSLDLQSAIFVPGYTNGVRQDFRSFSPRISSGLELDVHIKEISLGLFGGYHVDLTGELKDRDSGIPLEDPAERGRSLHSDWSGWRAGLRIILWFPG